MMSVLPPLADDIDAPADPPDGDVHFASIVVHIAPDVGLNVCAYRRGRLPQSADVVATVRAALSGKRGAEAAQS
jgi:hypothetical protein